MGSPINLQLGWPTPRLFPAEQLAKAINICLTNPKTAAAALVYGPDLGYTPLRSSIALWLSSFYNPPSGPIPLDRIAITGGASQNLASILHVFSDPLVTKKIWMVEPVYFLACTIFQDAGFDGKLQGVREDDHGIDIEFLRQALAKFEQEDNTTKPSPALKPGANYAKVYRHILYTTPTFSNPSAKTMSLSTRQALIALARDFDMLIISDDVYDWLRWPASGAFAQKLVPIPPRFVDLDRASSSPGSWGNSISNGSFSKIVAPGVRVGWAEASEGMILRLSQNGSTRSGGAPSHLTSTFLNEMLVNGDMEAHISNTLIPTYRMRYDVMLSCIKEDLEPLGVRITTGADYTETNAGEVLPVGGFFTYITFPENLPDPAVIAKRAREEYSLTFAFGEMFVVKGDGGSSERAQQSFGRGARLCWAWEEEDAIKEGIARLAELLKVMSKEAAVVTHAVKH